MRIGVDVGGVNTDAACVSDGAVLATAKSPTTPDVTAGLISSIGAALGSAGAKPFDIDSVMIGTTQFLNAAVQMRGLQRVGVLRLCGSATRSLPPMIDWPDNLQDAVKGHRALLSGGNEFDGSEITPLDEDELRSACRAVRSKGIGTVAVTGVFSPVDSTQELRAREIILEELPQADVTLSHEIGRLGLLERENAAILNAGIIAMARQAVTAYREGLEALGLQCPLFVSQNDGTLMSADKAIRFPVLTFASGPTNSMRGAAFLSGLQDAVVMDIGGITTDVGVLTSGFPREASVEAEIGGVRTNLRMPDIVSVGLGGGSRVKNGRHGIAVGPDSVGLALLQEAVVFGGGTVTATDIAVAVGHAAIGRTESAGSLDPALVSGAEVAMQSILEDTIDRITVSATALPLVLVGGGAILARDTLNGVSRIVRPLHASSANAVGAAIAQVSGEIDRVVSLESTSRHAALTEAQEQAKEKVVAVGALRETIAVVDVEETPLAYLPGHATRIRVKAVGDLGR